jgi:hypothetical protein
MVVARAAESEQGDMVAQLQTIAAQVKGAREPAPFLIFKTIQLILPRLRTHSGWLATDSLGFCDQSAHFAEQRSSALWVVHSF